MHFIWNETIKARVTRSGAEGAASTEQIRRYPSILKNGGIQQLNFRWPSFITSIDVWIDCLKSKVTKLSDKSSGAVVRF